MSRVFVGREAQLAETFRLLDAADDGAIVDLVGVHGIGKTTFLHRLVEEAMARGIEVFPVDIDHTGIGEGFINDYGPRASAAVLWEVFRWSRRLFDDLSGRGGREFNAYRAVVEQQGKLAEDFLVHNRVHLGRGARASNVEVVSTVNLSEEAVRDRIRRAQAAVDSAFIEAWAEYTARRQLLITVDTFDLIADDEIGHWAVRTGLRLSNTLVVLARLPTGHNVGVRSERVHNLTLPNFTRAEVARFLTRYVGEERELLEIAEVIHEFTDGHPGGVDLAARLVSEWHEGTRTPTRLRRELARLPDPPEKKWPSLVELILAAVKRPVLDEAVEAASVPTTFDEPLLAQIMTEEGSPPADAGHAIAALEAYGLVQSVPAPDGGQSGRFRLHEFIRLSLGARQRSQHPRRWEQLHRRAAQHCFQVLRDWEDSGQGSYGVWYRYEDPDWQAYKREWLYHSCQLTQRPQVTFARFVQVFLDAFWWWGAYHPFSFNRRLIEDWERSALVWPRRGRGAYGDPHVQAQQLADALIFILDNYPVGFLKSRSAQWPELESKLLLVQDLCGLGDGPRGWADPQDVADLGRTRGLLHIFLAHTRRYRDAADPEADAYYERAVTEFQALGDAWVLAWLAFERADLALERALDDETARLVADAARRAKALVIADDEWDHELVGNLHRVVADLSWHRGDRSRSAREYRRAVASAYWFQNDPHPPDGYTQQFYMEMTVRASDRVLALAAEGDVDAAVEFGMQVRPLPPSVGGVDRDGLRSLVAAADRAALVDGLFPRGPTADELLSHDTAFLDRWRRHRRHGEDPMTGLEELSGMDGPGGLE